MGKKYRLLGRFVGNAETGTVVPVLDPFQATLKFLSCRKIGNIFGRYSACEFLVGVATLEVRSCLKIGRGCIDVQHMTSFSPSPLLIPSNNLKRVPHRESRTCLRNRFQVCWSVIEVFANVVLS